MMQTIKDVPEEDIVVGGGPLCAGCPAVIGFKLALKALGKKTIIINASGCFTLFVTYPWMPVKAPWIHNAIENAGATASGIYRALKILKKEKDATIMIYAGDGATYDIGLQSLSGAITRGEKFIYISYNNQCFSNTGVQMSSATPFGARTTTTPPGRKNPLGNIYHPKPIAKMMADQGAAYVATASIGYPLDYMNKLLKAKEKKNQPAFIDLLCPCPPGWGFNHSKTIELAKLAVDTGAWPLYEIYHGKFMLTYKPTKLKPIEKYMEMQERFRHLKKKDISKIQKWVNEQWLSLTLGRYWEEFK